MTNKSRGYILLSKTHDEYNSIFCKVSDKNMKNNFKKFNEIFEEKTMDGYFLSTHKGTISTIC
jgi:glutamine amidotransferase-like uncharacterized protein